MVETADEARALRVLESGKTLEEVLTKVDREASTTYSTVARLAEGVGDELKARGFEVFEQGGIALISWRPKN